MYGHTLAVDSGLLAGCMILTLAVEYNVSEKAKFWTEYYAWRPCHLPLAHEIGWQPLLSSWYGYNHLPICIDQ